MREDSPAESIWEKVIWRLMEIDAAGSPGGGVDGWATAAGPLTTKISTQAVFGLRAV